MYVSGASESFRATGKTYLEDSVERAKSRNLKEHWNPKKKEENAHVANRRKRHSSCPVYLYYLIRVDILFLSLRPQRLAGYLLFLCTSHAQCIP